MRLMYLSSSKIKDGVLNENNSLNLEDKSVKLQKTSSNFNTDAVSQIKNITQEKKNKPEIKQDAEVKQVISIDSFDHLINICSEKKEMKLKYELEKNINLVGFEKNRIEISFNDNLDKNFVKELSLKLFEWTDERWIITFSKIKGDISIKEKEKNKKIEMIKKAKNSELYKIIIEKFTDANLIDVVSKKENK